MHTSTPNTPLQVLVGALGEYVDGIKANDIDVSLMSGTVELHNLVVRPEVRLFHLCCVAEFAMLICVRSAHPNCSGTLN